MESIKDSTFLNVVETVKQLEKAKTKPKTRGSRSAANDIGESQAEANLKEDVGKMVRNALSQQERVKPVPGLNGAQITALRALHAMVNNGKNTEKGLEMAVQAVVKLLNSEFDPKMQKLEQEEGGENKNVVTGTSIRHVTEKKLTLTILQLEYYAGVRDWLNSKEKQNTTKEWTRRKRPSLRIYSEIQKVMREEKRKAMRTAMRRTAMRS
jgi:hypothetical protein